MKEKSLLKRSIAITLALLLLVSGLAFAPAAVPTASASDGMAYVRVVHASPDAPNVDVYVDTDLVLSDVAYKDVSSYLSVAPGTYDFAITTVGGDVNSPVVDLTGQTVNAGEYYTVAAVGALADIELVALEDDTALPAPGNATVQVYHFSPDAPNVDIRVEGSSSPLIADLAFQNNDSVVVPDGTYNLEVAAAGTDTVAATLEDTNLQPDQVYSVFAFGLVGGTPAFEVVPQAEYGYVRVVHASPDAPNVDVYVDTDLVLSDVAYQGVSNYLPLLANEYDFAITTVGGDVNTPVVDLTGQTINGGQYYTVAAVGVLAGIELIALEDNMTRPDEDEARVNVYHFSPGTPAVELRLQDSNAPLIENLSFRETDSFEAPGGSYTVEIYQSDLDDTPPVTTLPVALENEQLYSVFAFGIVGDGDTPLQVIPQAELGKVRFAHTSPNAPNVDIYVNDALAVSDVPYPTLSDYQWFLAGTYSFAITTVGGDVSSPVVDLADETINGGAYYTIAAIGLLGGTPALELVKFEDERTALADGQALVQFYHLSPGTPAVTIDLQPAGTSVSALDNVSFGETATEVAEAGLYDVFIEGFPDPVLENVALVEGATYNVLAIGILNNEDTPLDFIVKQFGVDITYLPIIATTSEDS